LTSISRKHIYRVIKGEKRERMGKISRFEEAIQDGVNPSS